jgi:hypothetical protein
VGFEFYQEHELADHPEYRSVLHELRDEHGHQMMVIHMDVFRFAPSVLKRMKQEFDALRSCTDAIIFAIEPNPNDGLWHRYVSHMGFEFSSLVECTDGGTRRCYVSTAGAVSKKKNNDHFQHSDAAVQPAVERAAAVPHAGILPGERQPL